MALQFPSDPVANPTYEYEGVSYVWDGDRWVVDSTGTAGKDLQAVTDVGNSTSNSINIAALDFTQDSAGITASKVGFLKLQRLSSSNPRGEFIDAYYGTQQTFRVECDGAAMFKGTITGPTDKIAFDGGEVRVYGDYVSPNSGNGGVHLSYDPSNKTSYITAGSPNSDAPTLKFALVQGNQDPKADGRTPIEFNYDGSAEFDGQITAAAGYALAQLDFLP